MRSKLAVSLALVGLVAAVGCNGDTEPLDLGSKRGAVAGDGSMVPPGCTACRAFVTSDFYTGNLGGLEGADALCNKAAQNAQLGGKWTAWLADSTHSALTRIHGDGPWYLIEQTTNASSSRAALEIDPRVQFKVDEAGHAETPATFWTGTDQQSEEYNCFDWKSTSQTGLVFDTGLTSVSITANACSSENSLLCIEQ